MAPSAVVNTEPSLSNARALPASQSRFASWPANFNWPTRNERGYQIREELCGTERPLRVVACGGGISGVNLAKFLPETLNNVSLTIYDLNEELGGTWLLNTYPGVACDIPSHNYQFSWAKNPEWSQFYSSGAEIHQYILDVVAEHDLRKYFRLKHKVLGAYWDNERGVWEVQVKNLTTGENFVDTAEIFVNNDGILNFWRWPKIEGLHDFQGTLCHTARYNRDTVLDGKRVAVIGTGSSGIQVVPAIANKVSKLYTWIKSPTWITAGFAQQFAGPGGANFSYSEEQKRRWRENPLELQRYSKSIEDELNLRFKFILNGTPEAAEAREFSISQMKTKLQGREDIQEKILPTTFGVGCRRPTPGNGFLESLLLPNVTTFTKQMQKITKKGFVDFDGVEREVDVIICATGFDTSWVPHFPIVAHGQNLQDTRKKELLSYISLGVPDVPNYFTVGGPYGPFAHGSYVSTGECVVKNMCSVMKKMQKEMIKSVSPKREVCEEFVEHCDLYLKRTAWSGPCPSWFKNGDPNGRLNIFPASRLIFFDLLWEPRYEDYNIKYWSNRFNYFGNGFSALEFQAGADISYYLGNNFEPATLLPRSDKSAPKVSRGTTKGMSKISVAQIAGLPEANKLC